MDTPTTAHQLFVEATAELLRSGLPIQFSAVGRSMLPSIRDGETVTVIPLGESAIRRGEILLYRGPRGVVAHRCVAVEAEANKEPIYIMRGDSADECDAPVHAHQLLGIVISVERKGRQIHLTGRCAQLRRALQMLLPQKPRISF